MTQTQILKRFVKDIFRVVFVDGVVCQVHVQVVQVVLRSRLVLLSGKPHQALVVNVQAQRVAASNQGVYPEVEFQSLVEEGVVNVILHHALPR